LSHFFTLPNLGWLVALAGTPRTILYRQHLKPLLKTKISHLVFVPWLKHGGADLGALHWIEALAGLSETQSVLVVATENSDSPWQSRLPSHVQFIDAGMKLAQLSPRETSHVLARFIIQAQPDTAHIINSQQGWECIRRFGQAIRVRTRLYASVYCDDYDMTLVPRGYGRTALPLAWQHLAGIFSDNGEYPRLLQSDLGIPSSLFHTVYFPAPEERNFFWASHTNKILWASRLVAQKRPDLLIDIAQNAPNLFFYIFGSAESCDYAILKRLKRQKNIKLLGQYENFATIASEGFLAFLYTAAWDGLPNVLLEAASAGLPIIAPAIGGIGDFINQETGHLVHEHNRPESYIKAINTIATDKQGTMAKILAAQAVLDLRHSTTAFRSSAMLALDLASH